MAVIVPVYVQEEKNSGEERCDNEEAEKRQKEGVVEVSLENSPRTSANTRTGPWAYGVLSCRAQTRLARETSITRHCSLPSQLTHGCLWRATSPHTS